VGIILVYFVVIITITILTLIEFSKITPDILTINKRVRKAKIIDICTFLGEKVTELTP